MTEETKKRGFATMDPAKQREIARKGGKASHAQGTGHKWTPAEAAIAGSKAGRMHSREHMAEIGKKGGASRARMRKKVKP